MKIESGVMYPTHWTNIEKIPGNIMGNYTYVKGNVPTKRFAILFNLFTDVRISYSVSEYDDINACLEECHELNTLYKDHDIPTFDYNAKNISKQWDYEGKSWWGYIVLDFDKCQIIRVGGYGFKLNNSFSNTYTTSPRIIVKLNGANKADIRDYFFRDVNVVPDNYKWDTRAEYEGWLQFKWGDGKNAVGYVEPQKIKVSKPVKNEDDFEIEEYDNDYDNYEADLIEEKFADLLDKETRKNLQEKYGW